MTNTTTTDPKAAARAEADARAADRAEAEQARKARLIATIRRGGVGALRPPGGPTGHDPLDQAIGNYRRLFGEHRAARTDLAHLEGQRKQAVQADRDTWASNLVEGTEKDPGTKATDKADADLVVQRRKTDALAVAVDTAANAVLGMARTGHDPVHAHAAHTAADLRGTAAPALDALTGIAADLASAVALGRWIDNPAKGYHEPPIDTPLTRINGVPYTVAELLVAVRSALTR